MLRNAKELEHHELRARDGAIGHARDFFFDDRRWTVRYLVVDTGSWLDRREVLIAPAAVTRVDWEGRRIELNLSRAQVSNSPSIDTQQPVSREHEASLMQYYNWPAYWGAVGFPDVGFALPTMLTPATDPTLASQRPANPGTATAVREDYHLHSIRGVTGHAIEGTDGSVGHVEDFLIDELSWEIRYLVVDTRNWWPGKKVIVAPPWIREVGWDDARVHVNLTRAAIKASPAYDPEKPVTSDYTHQLHEHYNQARSNR